jgi:ABC-type sugar transport system ATPase subunit
MQQSTHYFTYQFKTPSGEPRQLELNWGKALLQPGKITRLSGPNGAGKTTLLQILAGLIQPSTGSIPDQKDVFFQPHQPGLRITLSAYDNLNYWAMMNNIKVKHYFKEIEKIIEGAKTQDEINERMREFFSSTGRRKLDKLVWKKIKKGVPEEFRDLVYTGLRYEEYDRFPSGEQFRIATERARKKETVREKKKETVRE